VSGNLYIADTHNHRIRKLVVATGILTTVAGSGTPGFSGDAGAAVAARLDLPTALAVDSGGNVFVADMRNHRIRKIDAATGVIATVAGCGIQGLSGDNGLATSAALDSPSGLAVDSSGNLYLADTHNQRIRKVTAATGIITTVAGSSLGPGLPTLSGDGGMATRASLALPRGVSLDAAGNLYVADSADQRIRRIATDGTITTVAGQGTESFSGDSGVATSASLDSPRAVTLSPGAQLSFADGGNARIRQLDASSVPQIRTIVGGGAGVNLSASAVSVTVPGSLTYGSGSIYAGLSNGSSATGSISFVDTATGTAVGLGTVGLSGGGATLDTSGLGAGSHAIIASYSGDSTHAAAQSQALAVTIAPLGITASAQPAWIFYGQPLPALTGVLLGVLPRDAGSLSATFVSSASALAPAGAYAVNATLSGAAAANYRLVSSSGTLTINKAPTATVLIVSSTAPATGVPVTFTFQAVSSTAGTPTGAITVLDGSSGVAQLPLAGGVASYTSSTLANGAHSLTATYSGDGNFLPSTSPTAALSVGTSADFSFSSTASQTQSVPSGSAATFHFALTPVGAPLSSPITLSVSGLPVGATASLNPAYIPPGGAVTRFTLTVQTTKTLSALPGPGRAGDTALASIVLGPFLLMVLGRGRPRGGLRRFPRWFLLRRVIFTVLACISSATLATGCGNRVALPAEVSTAPTYNLTVTGTATSATGTVLQHAVTVALKVL
jgi:hypothetical protein